MKVLVVLAVLAQVALCSVMTKCGDGSECPKKDTCCKLPIGGYGCCPFTDAVCCSGGVYCCPALTTCCRLAEVGYGCCPIPLAVCCSDGLHCCPPLTVCDVPEQLCILEDGLTLLMRRKVPAKILHLQSVEALPTWVTCTTCTYIVNEAKGYLVNNETIAEFLHILSKLCKVIPDKYNTQCMGTFESFPSIVKLIDSELSARVICGFLKLCGSGSTAAYSMTQCENCVAMTDSLGGPKEALLLTADTLCANLNINRRACTDLVQNYSEYFALLAPSTSQLLCNDVC